MRDKQEAANKRPNSLNSANNGIFNENLGPKKKKKRNYSETYYAAFVWIKKYEVHIHEHFNNRKHDQVSSNGMGIKARIRFSV